MLSAFASLFLVPEICFSFTYEIDDYIVEYVAFKMRYATVFNKFNIKSVVFSFMILFFWHTVIQKGHREK